MFIFMESGMVLLMVILTAQSSSLWSSLLIIPFSILIIQMTSSTNLNSGLISFLFIMVFVGGLMVLLVSVTSITHQEQSFYFMKMWFFISLMMLFPFLMVKKYCLFTTSVVLTSWLEEASFVMVLMILILVFCLWVLTKFIMQFKGMIRII